MYNSQISHLYALKACWCSIFKILFKFQYLSFFFYKIYQAWEGQFKNLNSTISSTLNYNERLEKNWLTISGLQKIESLDARVQMQNWVFPLDIHRKKITNQYQPPDKWYLFKFTFILFVYDYYINSNNILFFNVSSIAKIDGRCSSIHSHRQLHY